MIESLKQHYTIVNYHSHNINSPIAIIRHDIDNSIVKALELAQLEYKLGVKSTFFVLLKTDFYNPASRQNIQILKEIKTLGHEIGLHFDEMSYKGVDNIDIVQLIRREADILGNICDMEITTVSMHRPSTKTLEANHTIPGLINSYDKKFFIEFKYLSDSRRFWREPVMDIIKSRVFSKLHILTHAFWYNEIEESISDTIRKFVETAKIERYNQEAENIKDISSIISLSQIN